MINDRQAIADDRLSQDLAEVDTDGQGWRMENGIYTMAIEFVVWKRHTSIVGVVRSSRYRGWHSDVGWRFGHPYHDTLESVDSL